MDGLVDNTSQNGLASRISARSWRRAGPRRITVGLSTTRVGSLTGRKALEIFERYDADPHLAGRG
jgi:hypothetical protein